MTSEMLPMRAFMATFGKWLDAMQKEEATDAGFFVDQLHAIGMMLAVDPEFMRIYAVHQRRAARPSAEEALHCFHAFLHAVTDASRRGRYRNHQ